MSHINEHCKKPAAKKRDSGSLWACTCGKVWVVRYGIPPNILPTTPYAYWEETGIQFDTVKKTLKTLGEQLQPPCGACGMEWKPGHMCYGPIEFAYADAETEERIKADFAEHPGSWRPDPENWYREGWIAGYEARGKS